MTPAPFLRHQEICGNIYRLLCEHALRTHAGKVYIAPVDVVLSDADSYERAAELSLEAKDTLSSPLLPGLALPLSEIFG